MVAFSFFGISIYWYGIFYLVAALCCYSFFWFLGKKKYFTAKSPAVHLLLTKYRDDILLYGMAGVLIGARLGHVLIYDPGYYLHNPLHSFALREGGMSYIGGIFGVISALFLLLRKHKTSREEKRVFWDCLVAIIPVGALVGRIGNFLNQELYGRPVTEIFPHISESLRSFFVSIFVFRVYPRVDDVLRVNTNLLASFFEGFFILIILQLLFFTQTLRGRLQPGQLGGLYLALYSFVRFFLEYLRQDSQAEFVGLCTKSQRFFIFFFCLGMSIFVWTKKRKNMKISYYYNK